MLSTASLKPLISSALVSTMSQLFLFVSTLVWYEFPN